MTAAAIDLDVLNELFDNQKKLDDIFGSLFDDDSCLSASSYDEPTPRGGDQKDNQATYSKDNFADEFTQESRSTLSLVMPVVLEIAVIYYGIMYFY